MKRFIFTSFFIFTFTAGVINGYGQIRPFNPADRNEGFVLSDEDMAALSALPCLTKEDIKWKDDLPYKIDNSTQPYFRPLYVQTSVECGQYSGIAFDFTYEMDYARDLPANIPENQYPAHYTFNFMNGGFGWAGVSYMHSFEIAKINGHPNAADYQNFEQDVSYWMTGYEKYYHGMFNKIDKVYQIKAGTPDGLMVLKNWLDNHLVGAEVGGLACFYSASPWNTTTLPQGTPEGGKHVITGFSGNPGHACAIVGYNDSIRFDYNQDGQFTNDIDLNGDGILDMRDWEMGGLLFTDSYNGGIAWADSGFCYMMYKTLAEVPETGGIWNHAVHVVKVKNNYSPLLTMKVSLGYGCRNRIKVMAGVADDSALLVPQHTIDFPIFDYQGGCQYMQGGWDYEAYNIEFGLDVTPLLGFVQSGQPAKFFLEVIEDDPESSSSGQVNSLSLIDYTNGETVYPSDFANIAITDNGLTLIPVTATINFDQPQIEDQNLPMAFTTEPYSHQLTVNGGTAPYKWEMVRHYYEIGTQGEVPAINETQFEFSDTAHAMVSQKLPFSFPFYGKSYDTVYIHTDGFLMFDDQDYPWPYLHNDDLMIRKTKIITPFLSEFNYLAPGTDNGVWYEGDENHAAYRWKVSSANLGMDSIDFALILYPSGNIEFYFGSLEIFEGHNKASGISAGDDLNYNFTDVSPQSNMKQNMQVNFTPAPFPEELQLSQEGLLTGTTQQNYEGIPLEFRITDFNNITTGKVLNFYSFVEGTSEYEVQNNPVEIDVIPNPFKRQIKITADLQQPSKLKCTLLNADGSVVQTLLDQKIGKGHFSFLQNRNSRIKPGIYWLMVETDFGTQCMKLVAL